MFLFVILILNLIQAQKTVTLKTLQGIGYREQELQQISSNNFDHDSPQGIGAASFGGGTHIFIKGDNLNEDPQSNFVMMYSVDQNIEIPSFPLSEENAFNSNPKIGAIAYRLPAPHDLFAVEQRALETWWTAKFVLSIRTCHSGNCYHLKCANEALCTVYYKKHYTPIIAYMVPPVVYNGMNISLHFNPRRVQDLIKGLASDETVFLNSKIDNTKIDFPSVTYETRFNRDGWSFLKGIVGDQQISNNHNISMLWETGYAEKFNEIIKTCHFDMSDCYEAKTLPVILSVSQNKTYLTGGSNLTVTGFGFDMGELAATIDGVECKITQTSRESFSCTIQPKNNISLIGHQKGHNGLRRNTLRGSQSFDYTNFAEIKEYDIAPTFETRWDHLSGVDVQYIYEGWFIPPKTSQYRFWVTCRSKCQVQLATEPNNITVETVWYQGGGKISGWNRAHRAIIEDNGGIPYRTQWFNMTEGMPYFIKGQNIDNKNSAEHMSVGVEINETIKDHWHQRREVQFLGVQSNLTFEKTKIIIDKLDNEKFLLLYQAENLTLWKSTVLKANCTKDELWAAVKDFYKELKNTNIGVTRDMYDQNGDITDNVSNATKFEFTIELKSLIGGQSVADITPYSLGTAANITVKLPKDVQLTATALDGYYRIKCTNYLGFIQYTRPLKVQASTTDIRNRLMWDCYGLLDKIDVYPSSKYSDWRNGISFYIHFNLQQDPGQFEIVDTLDNGLRGQNHTFFAETTTKRGQSIFYDVIPFEMLKTYVVEPQIEVKVNGMTALCADMKCGIPYIESIGNITQFTFDPTTKKVVITGNDLPENRSLIQSINFAQSECQINEGFNLTNTTLECTLVNDPTCGSYKPLFVRDYGLIPVDPAAKLIQVSCSASNIVPSVNLNLLGGDDLTISGANFPKLLKDNTIDINFDDTTKTLCIIKSTATDKIVCTTKSFDRLTGIGQTYGVSILINKLVVPTSTMTVTISSDPIMTHLMNVTSVSPVLKTRIGFTLDSRFPTPLRREDFSINATSKTNSSYVRMMNVISTNDSDKKLTTIFGGAWSGKFNIVIHHKQLGILDTSNLELLVESSVTSISPKKGSIYGGTLITIQGTNFGTKSTDNPVQISYNGGLGSTDCYIQTINQTQITCRTKDGVHMGYNAPQILKTSKKGMPMNPQAVNCDDVVNIDASWYYNWSPNSNGCKAEFIPMIWNDNNIDQVLANLPDGSEWLLGFNEPNLKEQANMTPEYAASLWPKLQATGRKLVSPAMAMPGIDWMDQFMGNCTNCTINAIAIHTYESNTGGTAYWVNQYAKYGLPIWVTEFCQPGSSDADTCQNYVRQSVYDFENDPRIEKYAWFMNRKNFGNLEACGSLFDDNGALTAAGKTYRDTYRGTVQFKDYERVGEVVVFQKASEEAKCEVCNFNMTADVPIVNQAKPFYEKGSWYMVITGSVFTNSAEFFIEGKKQEVQSIDPQNIKVKIIDVNSGNLTNMKLYFDIGRPHNHSEVFTPLQQITPKLEQLSISKGSIGGSKLIITAQGAGIYSDGIEIVDKTSNQSICQSLRVISYSKIECITKAIEIAETEVALKQGTVYSECQTACVYRQLANDNFPSITALEKLSSTQLKFVGTNFYSTDFQIDAQILNISADSMISQTATEVIMEWKLGLPSNSSSLVPSLYFHRGEEGYFAISTQNISNPVQISEQASPPNILCSYSGGCKFELVATGLTTQFKNDQTNTYISVCDQKCPFIESESSADKVVCSVPYLSTSYSIENFNIVDPGILIPKNTFASSEGQSHKAFDNQTFSAPFEASDQCYVGVAMKTDHVAILSKVKFFLHGFTIPTYVNVTKFQGSNDGVTYTDLFTFEENLHDGWNYHEWNDTEKPKFRYYRFKGTKRGSCEITEIILTGVETIDSKDENSVCGIQLFVAGVSQTLNQKVEYRADHSSQLTSITPRYGSVEGGTDIVIAGKGFTTKATDITVTIDGINCPVSSSTETEIRCKTGSRPGLRESTLKIFINEKGLVSNNGILFKYVSFWSADSTWGGEFAPMHMESIHVPKGLNLFIDIDETPEINLILVEGSLTIAPDADPKHHRKVNAHYIFVHHGQMEVGTEEFPYTSKLTITMFSNIRSPYIPIFGNKVLAVKNGILDMHGVKKKSWSVLNKTVMAGEQAITVHEKVDWTQGDQIVIASTSYNHRQSETRFITNIDNTNPDNPILTLDRPLNYKHYAATEYYGGVEFDMRAEVGLLTKNIVFRGDPKDSKATQYGGTIFLHSSGDDSVIGRLSDIELTDVGQAFKVGRYAIHFHMIGAVHQSYARRVSVHTSFNRAFTIHGTHYLRLMENVAYNVKGHTIFIEDAIESKNFIYKNLVISTIKSMSLLNTDQSPANFWITFPDNDFLENHAAGADNYGFWFDLQPHAIGPSANKDVCPTTNKAGLFYKNQAHSNGKYGFRIFHEMSPRKYACRPTSASNPWLETRIETLTSWKNGNDGAITEKIADVKLIDLRLADNLKAGIEISFLKAGSGKAGIHNSTIVLRSGNYEGGGNNARGIITAKNEGFEVKNVSFYNYDVGDSAAFGTCTHCKQMGEVSDDGFTHKTWDLKFINSAIINQQFPQKAIFWDQDGTLTGATNGFVTHNYKHLINDDCQYNATYNGVVCNPNAKIRVLRFGNKDLGRPIHIANMDDSTVNKWIANNPGKTEWDYRNDLSNYQQIPFQKTPNDAYTVPYVPGKKYIFHFAEKQYDELIIRHGPYSNSEDPLTYMISKFETKRHAIFVDIAGQSRKLNNTLPFDDASYTKLAGDNIVLNETYGKKEARFIMDHRTVTLIGKSCLINCQPKPPPVEVKPVEETIRLWSNENSWGEGGHVPLEGENVTIQSGWNMFLDVPDTPKFDFIFINGKLSVYNNSDINLKANKILIRTGEFNIGSADAPYQGKAIISLNGTSNETEHSNHSYFLNQNLEEGGAYIANIGKLAFFGKPRIKLLTRLRSEVFNGTLNIIVDPNLDYEPGDLLALLPTSYSSKTTEKVEVLSYDAQFGNVTLKEPLKYYHYGAIESTAKKYNGIDIRAEVLLLSRNIKIQGLKAQVQLNSSLSSNTTLKNNNTGCQIVTAEIIELTADLDIRAGSSIMDHVEVLNCGQELQSSIRFDSLSSKTSSVTNSAIHSGIGRGGIWIKKSSGVTIKNNFILDHYTYGIQLDGAQNSKVYNNVVANISMYPFSEFTKEVTDKMEATGGIIMGSFTVQQPPLKNIEVQNNIVAGTEHTAYTALGHACGNSETQQVFKNNIAHSIESKLSGIGAIIMRDLSNTETSKCLEGSYFAAYKCSSSGIASMESAGSIVLNKVTMIDNMIGVAAMAQGGLYSEIKDSFFFGETEALDCPPNGGFCYKVQKSAIIGGISAGQDQSLHPVKLKELPYYTIKKTNGIWGSKTVMKRNKFFYFNSSTRYGRTQSIIEPMHQPDYIPHQEFYNSHFIDVEIGALGRMGTPSPGWANLDDCGDFTCTGLWNTVWIYIDSIFESTNGTVDIFAEKDFTIIPDTPNAAIHVKNCLKYGSINGYYCRNKYLGILMFESLDADKLDRAMQPIYYKKEGSNFNNKLNAYMDHAWDGFYTTHKRKSIFPGLVDATPGSLYEIEFTGSPAQNMRFILRTPYKEARLTVRIYYPSAVSRQIIMNGEYIPYNQWDKSINNYGVISQKQECGENRYIGVKNIFEFAISGGCELIVKPRDAIQGMVRMEWTMKSFYEQGGTTSFVDRLSSVLGIHASEIKVVSVYEGSLVIDFQITDSNDSKENLQTINKNLDDKFATGKIGMELGAPVLDFKSNGTQVVQDGIVVKKGYDPIIITKTSTNQGLDSSIIDSSQLSFDPNLDYDTSTATIFQPEVPQFQNLIPEQETVIVTNKQTNKILTKKDEKSQTSQLITVLFITLLLVFVLYAIFLIARHVMRSNSLKFVEKGGQRRRNIEITKIQDFNQSEEKSLQNLSAKSQIMEEQELQYDANHDFAIFQAKQGGHQTLQEKMNIADGLPEIKEEPEEENGIFEAVQKDEITDIKDL